MIRLLVAALTAAPLAWAAECSGTSTGLTPFANPNPPAYFGEPATLYPGGNRMPAPHLALGLSRAAEIVPRDAAGNPDPAGSIVVLSIGMSNTTQEFSAFIPLAMADQQRNPRVMPVDGAVGGMTPETIAADPERYWSRVEGRIQQAHATNAQVQVAWLKQAEKGPRETFPGYPRRLEKGIQEVIRQARERFPNLKIVYLSSRIYGGYASTALNPEPYAYQSAFAVRWLIERQMAGDPELAQLPWLAWGPYLWADGTVPRHDGLTWQCEDFRPDDGTHPSDSGRMKVARMLLDFLHSDATARAWYIAPMPASPQPVIGAVVNAAGYGAAIAEGTLATLFGADLAGETAAAAAFPLPRELAGTRVEAGGVPSLLYYVSPTQINFVMPPEGGTKIRVLRGETAADAAPTIAAHAPGVFTLDGAAEGPAAAAHPDGTAVSQSHPARPGGVLQLFGTGIAFGTPVAETVIGVGGTGATVTYAGPAPWLPGVAQVNFIVPGAAPKGDSVPLVLQLGGAASNAATLAVAR